MKKLLIGAAIIIALLFVGLRFGPDLVMQAFLEPGIPFDETTPPPAPDYTNDDHWAALPGRIDAADQLPVGVTAPNEAERRAAVFFIYPTILWSNTAWNADVTDPRTNFLADYLSVMGQASAFNKCCTIYAPRYRQATAWTYWGAGDEAGKPLNLAYQDIAAAFDHFLSRIPADQPIIVAGHSQGSTHLFRLLADKIVGTPVMNRLVAAYAVGVFTPKAHKDIILPTLPLCETATATKCLLTWDFYKPGGDPMVADNPKTHWVGDAQNLPDGTLVGSAGYAAPPVDPRLCVNPFNWQEPNGGAVKIDLSNLFEIFLGDEPDYANPPKLGAVSDVQVTGTCLNGGLVLNAPYPDFVDDQPEFAGGGSLHLLDYQLVYMDVFHNAARRVDAYIDRNRPQ